MIYRRAVNACRSLFYRRICIIGRGKNKRLKRALQRVLSAGKVAVRILWCYEPVKFGNVGRVGELAPARLCQIGLKPNIFNSFCASFSFIHLPAISCFFPSLSTTKPCIIILLSNLYLS